MSPVLRQWQAGDFVVGAHVKTKYIKIQRMGLDIDAVAGGVLPQFQRIKNPAKITLRLRHLSSRSLTPRVSALENLNPESGIRFYWGLEGAAQAGIIGAEVNPDGTGVLTASYDEAHEAEFEHAFGLFVASLRRHGWTLVSDREALINPAKHKGDKRKREVQLDYLDKAILSAYKECVDQDVNPTDVQIANRIPKNHQTGRPYTREWVNGRRRKLRALDYTV